MDLIPFRPGDRVMLNAHGLETYANLRVTTGTYLHPARDTVRMVVQRDGLRNAEIWSSSYWELLPQDEARETEVLPTGSVSVDRPAKQLVALRLPTALVERCRQAARAQGRTLTSLIRADLEVACTLRDRVSDGERVYCERAETGERTRILIPPV